ncbi:MAG TPA: hypothetical protein VG944_14615 [Fimbriimonas sp.]|nr:hypothetical protein [Fimbriimonas sp.]
MNLFDREDAAGELFGSVYPEGYKPLAEEAKEEYVPGGLTDWATKEDKKKRSTHTKHYDRAKAILNERWPGKYWKADYCEAISGSGWAGPQITRKDVLGLFDVMGLAKPDGRCIGCQITTRESVGAHLRKYTDPKKTHGSGKVPIENHLREFLACGGRFVILGFWQETTGRRLWQADMTLVTPELLDQYKARKRSAV